MVDTNQEVEFQGKLERIRSCFTKSLVALGCFWQRTIMPNSSSKIPPCEF